MTAVAAELHAPSLLELAERGSDSAEAQTAMEFMLQWALVRRALGHAPGLADYARWWGCSRSTAFRAQRRFRRCFPGERTPDRLLDLTEEAWDERDGLAGLRSIRIPPAVLRSAFPLGAI